MTLPLKATFHTLLLGFVACSVIDVTITLSLLSTGDYVEINPIAARVYELWGGAGLFVYKCLTVSILIGVFYTLHQQSARAARSVLIGANLFMGAVVAYSLGLLTHFCLS